MIVEEMEFNLNDMDYLYVGPKMGFQACIILFWCNSCNGRSGVMGLQSVGILTFFGVVGDLHASCPSG